MLSIEKSAATDLQRIYSASPSAPVLKLFALHDFDPRFRTPISNPRAETATMSGYSKPIIKEDT